VFPHRDLGKLSGAALYMQLDAKQLLLAGGLHGPTAKDLHAVRAHISANVSRFRYIVEAPTFRRTTGGLQGERSVRTPRGFAVQDEVAEYLKFKQFLVWVETPAALATTSRFYPTVLKIFRAAAPLVRFVNEPLVGRPVDPLRP
jgi:uncharacterized protein (TIGR02453 family)